MNFVQSAPGSDPIVVEGYFAASPERVFNAWTNPDVLRKWFGLTPNSLEIAEIDLRVGGSWRLMKSEAGNKTIGFEGQYQDVRPAERLVFSWSHVVSHESGEREQTAASIVEIDFTPKGKGTFVRLVHSAIASEDARRGVGGGWESSFTSLSDLMVENE